MGEAATVQTPAATPGQEWFTTVEAAVYVRMEYEALRKQISTGRLKPDSPSRPGFRGHRFRRATLDAWLMGTTGDNDNGQK